MATAKGNDDRDAVADAEELVALALERSVYVAEGPDHGLTADELSDIAVCVGRDKNLILSVANEMRAASCIIRKSDGRYRMLPGDWRFTKFSAGLLWPELRVPPVLEGVEKLGPRAADQASAGAWPIERRIRLTLPMRSGATWRRCCQG
jgi:hypothetical protein